MSLLALALWGMGLVAIAYQVVALLACLTHLRRRDREAVALPPMSLLKPVRGVDPRFFEAIRSHAALDYPEFEVLFGVSDRHDPAVAEIERLMEEFPHRSLRLIHCLTVAPNAKVGVLIDLAREARHDVWVVNDGDILVPPDYLQRLAGPLTDDSVGLVTCLYRADGPATPSRFEALGIATDFAPSVLVAQFVGVGEFGLGSTLAFRKERLEMVGGFARLAEYLADDYQLGKAFSAQGWRNHLSRMVVETSLGGDTWAAVWAHQVRWARTIRVSRGGGYLGLPVTQASLWAVIALLAGQPVLALALLVARYLTAWVAGVQVLDSRLVRRWWLWVPLRDLWGTAVWVAGLWGREVEWRGRRLRLDGEGRILR